VGALAALARGGAENTRLASVSRACAATYAPDVRVETIIPNGIDVANIPFGPDAAEPRYLLFAGRMAAEKGLEDAVAIARRAGRRLLVAGGAYDEEYFATRARPLLTKMEAEGRGKYLGLVPRERLWELMAGAEALVCPIHWEEPFGLVPCEAQAAGAPVVGYARGALPEVVADGTTGWLVPEGDIGAAVAAVGRVGEIARAECRARVAQRFSLGAMLDAHERVYEDMLDP
jgi:glycosyltransferase involved in cell wall biosynthesis